MEQCWPPGSLLALGRAGPKRGSGLERSSCPSRQGPWVGVYSGNPAGNSREADRPAWGFINSTAGTLVLAAPHVGAPLRSAGERWQPIPPQGATGDPGLRI